MSTHSPAMLRLQADLKEIATSPPEGVSASPCNDDNLFVWNATIVGPSDTPYEGGIYSLRICFGSSYPEKPPKIKFMSEMLHPNIYTDGSICLDTIQDRWSPVNTISSLLTSIQSLLSDPNCTSPANPEAAQLYQTDRAAYNKRVRRLAQKTLES